jgi:hypothetical protein
VLADDIRNSCEWEEIATIYRTNRVSASFASAVDFDEYLAVVLKLCRDFKPAFSSTAAAAPPSAASSLPPPRTAPSTSSSSSKPPTTTAAKPASAFLTQPPEDSPDAAWAKKPTAKSLDSFSPEDQRRLAEIDRRLAEIQASRKASGGRKGEKSRRSFNHRPKGASGQGNYEDDFEVGSQHTLSAAEEVGEEEGEVGSEAASGSFRGRGSGEDFSPPFQASNAARQREEDELSAMNSDFSLTGSEPGGRRLEK